MSNYELLRYFDSFHQTILLYLRACFSGINITVIISRRFVDSTKIEFVRVVHLILKMAESIENPTKGKD